MRSADWSGICFWLWTGHFNFFITFYFSNPVRLNKIDSVYPIKIVQFFHAIVRVIIVDTWESREYYLGRFSAWMTSLFRVNSKIHLHGLANVENGLFSSYTMFLANIVPAGLISIGRIDTFFFNSKKVQSSVVNLYHWLNYFFK